MNFHSPEAANVAAWREKAECLEEENRQLKQALTTKTHQAEVLQSKLKLTPSESKILDLLVSANGGHVSRRQIGARLYGINGAPRNGEGETGTVNVLLTKLRYKLRAINTDLEIKNSWSLGWLIAPHHRSIILAHVGETTVTLPPPNSNS